MIKTGMIKKIVVSGDFLRPSRGAQLRPNQHYNTQWLHNLLAQQLEAATGLPVDMVAWCFGGVTQGRLTETSVTAIYESLCLPVSIAGWVELYERETLPDDVDMFIASLFRDSLAIFFELPPVVEHVLKRHGIPYIDATVHPVRFLDDICLGFRASDAALQDRLDGHRLSEAFIRTMAGLQKAAAGRLYAHDHPPGTLLLLMQVRDDKTLIENGRFLGAADFLAPITDLASRHPRCLVRPHPLDEGNPGLALLLASIPNLVKTSDNYYRLLSAPNITHVASISSGTCIEAPYFGKAETYFYRRPYTLAAEGQAVRVSDYIGIYNHFLHADFWRDVLAPLCAVTPPDGMRVPEKPNRLRQSLREFWRFSEIDTDVLVEQYMKNRGLPV